MKKILCALVVSLTLVVDASAQSISSFRLAEFSGITVERSGNSITLNVAGDATLTYLSQTYDVNSVFGVWALDDTDDMSGTGTNQNGWRYDENYAGFGGIAGWKTNPNDGLLGSSLSFTYASLDGSVEDFGFHIRVDGELPGGGNTAYFRAVPEPATMAALGLGLAAALRRRRRK